MQLWKLLCYHSHISFMSWMWMYPKTAAKEKKNGSYELHRQRITKDNIKLITKYIEFQHKSTVSRLFFSAFIPFFCLTLNSKLLSFHSMRLQLNRSNVFLIHKLGILNLLQHPRVLRDRMMNCTASRGFYSFHLWILFMNARVQFIYQFCAIKSKVWNVGSHVVLFEHFLFVFIHWWSKKLYFSLPKTKQKWWNDAIL